jgi:hypothetical protein
VITAAAISSAATRKATSGRSAPTGRRSVKRRCDPDGGGIERVIASRRVLPLRSPRTMSPPDTLYGPAVRCKSDVTDLERLVLLICIRPVEWSLLLLAIMGIRTHPISFASRQGRMCHQNTDATVDRFSISSIQLADLGGNLDVVVVDLGDYLLGRLLLYDQAVAGSMRVS